MIRAGLPALLTAADVVRREVWRLAVRTRLGRACARDRAARLTTLAVGHVLIAFILTGIAPLWLLLLGPLVLGVPHVIGDIRYLLIRPPRDVAPGYVAMLLGPLALLTAVRLATVLGYGRWPLLEVALGAAAVVGVVLIARGPLRRRALVLSATVGLAAAAFARPELAALLLAHLHNAIGFGLWLWLAMRERRAPGYVMAATLYLAIAVFIIMGGLDGAAYRATFSAPAGLSLEAMMHTLAPGVPGALGYRLVLLFAFAQAVHYAVWVRLVPGSAPWAVRPASPTFHKAWGELRRDFGGPGTILAIGACLGILVFAAVDPAGTRATYLSMVLFHGWLEIAVVAHLLAHRAP